MYVLKLLLDPSPAQMVVFEKRFLAVNKLHNELVSHCIKMLNRLDNSGDYQKWKAEAHEIAVIAKKKRSKKQSAHLEELYAQMNAFREKIGLTLCALEKWPQKWRLRYTDLVSSQIMQAEVRHVWDGVKDVLFGKGKTIHYRKFTDMHSVSTKSNTNGIIFDQNTLTVKWMGSVIPCKIDEKNKYISDALHLKSGTEIPISYCQIVRQAFPDGWHYYVHITIREKAPAPKKERKFGKSRMGVDPGVSTVAGESETGIVLEELAPDYMRFEREISHLQRKMDRSLRAENPDNYNPDGTVKPKSERKPWVYSKEYIRTLWKLRDAYRRKTAYVIQSHSELANRILEDSIHFIVEKNNFSAMARRSKKPAERQEKESVITKKDGSTRAIHKYKKTRRLGRSFNARSPARFLTILKNKALAAGGSWQEIKTQEFAASQYNHVTKAKEKIPLSQRSKIIDGHNVQRDLYSAFLIRHSVKDGTHPNRSKCKRDFPDFCRRQDKHTADMKAAGISMKQCFGF
ncbi:MAG: hypothetical protein LUE86_05720 [Clostridiales bacterium]|nr:hypothetical protein [Clostridiales bacterium]